MSELKEQLLAEVTNKETGLTLMEEAFLDNLFEFCSGNIRAAMTKAGYPKDTPESHVTKPLGKHIRERAKEYLTSASALASIQLVNLLIDPNQPGAKNIVSASKEILDRSGVYKEEGTKVTEVRNMFILPPKDSEPDIKIIDHEE